MTKLDSFLKSRDIILPTKVCLVKATVFSSSHVWMWEVDCKESWAPKNWCFWTMVLEKTFESSFDLKEIQSVHSKGNQSWIFLGSTDVEAETPTVWLPDAKSWLIWKDPDTGLTSKLSWWKIHLQWRRPWFDSWVWKTHWRRDRLPTPVFLGFPCGLASKESACNVGDLGSILGLGRSPGEGKGYPLQFSGLENSMGSTVQGS